MNQSEQKCPQQQKTSSLDILVLGVGNILLSDEGAGVRAITRLKDKYTFPSEIELLDGGTSGMDLLPFIENKSHVLIIDSIKDKDNLPGTIKRIDLNDSFCSFRQKLSPHQIGLPEILAMAEMRGCFPQSITLFGIVPKDISTGLKLSPEVEQKLEELSRILVKELRHIGLQIQNKEQA